jgi:hypothetical protein
MLVHYNNSRCSGCGDIPGAQCSLNVANDKVRLLYNHSRLCIAVLFGVTFDIPWAAPSEVDD